ncbi:hypothetical protein [Actinophytocola glycyrrhizae]|uniref:Uncharacterized protein n=1 Tax=Actinophytocola glycyrrhizae TaxID=2044873 RepID=A0ABV9RVY4_9PSEU
MASVLPRGALQAQPIAAFTRSGASRYSSISCAAPVRGGEHLGSVAAAMRAEPEYVGAAGHQNSAFMRLVPGAI